MINAGFLIELLPEGYGPVRVRRGVSLNRWQASAEEVYVKPPAAGAMRLRPTALSGTIRRISAFSNRMAFFAELKRRHVLRVAALYAAVAWLLIQVTDVVSEPLGLPGWLLKVVIWLTAIGFPVALVIAWSFELTPQGLLRDPSAPWTWGSGTSSTGGLRASSATRHSTADT